MPKPSAEPKPKRRTSATTVGEYLHYLLDETDWLREQMRLMNEEHNRMKAQIVEITAERGESANA